MTRRGDAGRAGGQPHGRPQAGNRAPRRQATGGQPQRRQPQDRRRRAGGERDHGAEAPARSVSSRSVTGPARARLRQRSSWFAAAARGDPGKRLGISLLCIAFVLSLFAGRLVQLQGFESAAYRKKAVSERLATIPLPAVRGSILAADGQPLAMTDQTFTVFADPGLLVKDKVPFPDVAEKLSGPLAMPASQVLGYLQNPTSADYVILKTGVTAVTGTRIAGLNLTGVGMQPTYARSYPDGDATANVVGFTNGELHGAAGIELASNALLAGHPGSEQVEIGTDGQPIPLAGMKDRPAVNGSGLKLTIIPALQWDAEQQCKLRVQQTHARDCTAIVLQPSTGHILAMAQWPTYSQSRPVNTSNLAVQDVFEPGSTAKVITAAAAFEKGGKTPMSAYSIPHAIYEGGQVIHDSEWSPGERYTIAGIIAHSSNIGMSQVANSVSPQVQYQYLRAFGLGQQTGVGLPGESAGILHPLSQYWASLRYNLAYGQGVDVTALQMASVYATIANGGVRVQPTLITGTTSPNGHFTPAAPSPSRRVIQQKTARDLIRILQQVPAIDEAGGQPWGIIPGYSIAAKTGTSNESGPHCKNGRLCEYGSSFIGMAPGDNPQLVVAVNVQHPSRHNNDYFGDVVAGPVFYHIMQFALQTLQIPPDNALVPKVRLNAPR